MKYIGAIIKIISGIAKTPSQPEELEEEYLLEDDDEMPADEEFDEEDVFLKV